MSVTFESGLFRDHPLKEAINTFCTHHHPLPEEVPYVLQHLSYTDTILSITLDGDSVIGTIFYIPAQDNELITENAALVTWLSDRGLTLDVITFPAMALVDPDYRGRGYMTTMATRVTQLSIDNGFSHQITLGYESDSANQYNNHVGRMVDTGLVFIDGKPIYMRSNEDILDALAP